MERAELAELAELVELMEFAELTELMEKMNSSKKSSAAHSTLIYTLSMTSMVWNISTVQLRLAAWLCSLPVLVHLLISKTWETGKSP